MNNRVMATAVFALACATANSQYTRLWYDVYDGAAHGTDQGFAIATDKFGNTFATGWSDVANEGKNIVTLKLSPIGTRYSVEYNGAASGEDAGRAVTTDDAGNVYVAGYVTQSGTNDKDVFVRKYSNSLELVWTTTYNSGSNREDVAVDIAIDSQYVYVTGWTRNVQTSGTMNYLTIKMRISDGSYDEQQGHGWVRTLDGPAGDDDQAVAVATANGDVWVTGWITGGQGVKNWRTMKYLGNGNNGGGNWPRDVSIQAPKPADPSDIAVDVNGVSFVTGYKFGDSVFDRNYLTVSYTDNGSDNWGSWAEYTGASSGSNDVATALAVQYNLVGAAEYVYVTGYSGDGGTPSHDYATLKYNASTGAQIGSAARYDRNSTDDVALAIATTGNGSVYITGRAGGDYVTIAYDNTLTARWTALDASATIQANAIAVSCAGLAHVTGFSQDSNGYDYYTALYKDDDVVTESTNTLGYSIILGDYVSGNAASLADSDNNRLRVDFPTSSEADYPVTIVISASPPSSTASEFCVTFEGYTSALCNRIIEFWDGTSAVWRKMDERVTTTSDSVTHIRVPYDPQRFIDDGVGHPTFVKIRVKYSLAGLAASCQVHIDQVQWSTLP